MSRKTSEDLIEKRIFEMARTVAEKNELELVHAEKVGSGNKTLVRVFIDKPEGVSHEDCSIVSEQLSEMLDAVDVIPTAYLLEVSSPGLERELYSLKDFEKYAGSPAKVKISKPISGQKNFRGRIIRVEGEQIVFEDKTSGPVSFPYGLVAKANLEFDLEEELKRK